jgi:hypothetical protein
MARSIAASVLALLGAAGACNKRATPEARRAVRIAPLGATIDAPPGWELTEVGNDTYRVGAGGEEGVFVRAVAFPPRTLDELYATECARAAAPGTRATTPAGAMVVACSVPLTTKDGKSIELVHAASLIAAGGRGIKCHFGTSGDPEAALAACRSLRR